MSGSFSSSIGSESFELRHFLGPKGPKKRKISSSLQQKFERWCRWPWKLFKGQTLRLNWR
jgi:hypothetical protein